MDMKMHLSYAKAAILAGLTISIGGMALVKVGPGFGTVLFSVGLLAVFLLGGKLCTGMFGYIRSGKDALNCLAALICNTLAAYVCGLLFKACCGEAATIANKLVKPLYHVFLSGVVCGVLIYIAVEGWRQTGQILAVMLPVAAFVGMGAEHCIADAFFFGAAGGFDLHGLVWWLCSVAGNLVGGLIAGFLKLNLKPAGKKQ